MLTEVTVEDQEVKTQLVQLVLVELSQLSTLKMLVEMGELVIILLVLELRVLEGFLDQVEVEVVLDVMLDHQLPVPLEV